MRLWLPALLQQIKGANTGSDPDIFVYLTLPGKVCPEEIMSKNINAFFQNVQSLLIENKNLPGASFQNSGNR